MADEYTFVDLFAGMSGFTCGMQRWFRHLCGFDIWDDAIETSKLNNLKMRKCDLANVSRSVRMIKPYAPDIIIGGTPCQSFSLCSTHFKPELANLTLKFARIVCKIKPKMFMLENTPNAPKFDCYQQATNMLLDFGYDILRVKVDASRCGSPQHRVRVFQIGVKATKNSPKILEKLGAKVCNKMRKGRKTVLGDVLQDVHGLWHYPRNYYCKCVFGPQDVFPTVRGMCLVPPPTKKSKFYEIENPKNYCLKREATVPTCEIIAKIQGFPKKYKFFKPSRQSIQVQLGNAVPVKVSRYIGKLGKTILEKTKDCEVQKRKGILVSPEYAIPR